LKITVDDGFCKYVYKLDKESNKYSIDGLVRLITMSSKIKVKWYKLKVDKEKTYPIKEAAK
jgi:hypothetical protein